jgi:hypothetical protein
MTSKAMRKNPLFMRNSFPSVGKWGIPLVKKQVLSSTDINLIAGSNTRTNDSKEHRKMGVHFFVDDYRFNNIYTNPKRSLKKYAQYAFLLTPDFSTYADMDLWRQLESVARNRWVGAYWQSKGLTIIPTVSWSTSRSFEFCFDGIEQGGTVAVGMIGCSQSKKAFLRGYNEMLERLTPEKIIVYGNPFKEMQGNLIRIEYQANRKKVR